ncbi:MAG TPA: hypothetical protein V6C95_08885 [Coleofasciculaceae cyanobacterium]
MFRKRQHKHLGWQLIERLWGIILAVVSGLQANITHQPKQHHWQRQRRIACKTIQLNRPRRFWRFLTTAITVFIFTINLSGITPWLSSPAFAAAQLTITPISWNILGLDSNNVNVGPNTYMAGARVCNIGNTTATNVKATFVRDGAVNPYINLQAASTLSVASLPAGSSPPSQYTINYTPTNCTDFYYNIVVTRTSAAYDTIQRFHIDATADGLGIVSTPTPRELYVEKILSQARNSVLSWTGPTTVYQGQVYQYTTTAKTATAYPQLTFLADFPNTVFQLLSAKITYSLPTGAINSTIYADACGWVNDPTSSDYHRSATNCNLPDNYSGGAAGNDVTTVYTVKILSTGTTTVSNLIYDFSGGSYHYNADYGKGINSITITALQPPPADLTVTKTHTGDFTRGSTGSYAIAVTNMGGAATSGLVTVSDTLPTGLTATTVSGTGWTCTVASGGASFSCTRNDALASSLSYPTLTVNVNVAANTPESVTNTAIVSGGGEINTLNNKYDDPTKIVSDGCNLGGGTSDGAIAPYISPEVTNNVTATRSLVDTLDDTWRIAAGGVSSGTIQPWFGTSSSLGSVSSFTYLDPSTSSTVNATVQLVLININGVTNCAGISNTTSSTPLLATSAALQDGSPRPASLYNSANQPAFWNQTIVSGNDTRRFAARFTFSQPVKSFGAWFGDLETRTVNGTPAILRLLDASGNRIGNDIVIQPTTLYDGNPPDPESFDQAQCGSSAANIACGNSSTRWVGFVDSSSAPRVSQVLVIVGDDDFNDDGDTEILSFIGANIIPVASNPNLLLVKRITAINGVDFTNFVDDPISNNDNASNWPTPSSTYLRGAINSTVKPGDGVEYTIYFLSNGSKNATNVKLCDLVPTNTTFVPTAFNGLTPTEGGLPGSDRGIALALNSTSLPANPTVYLTNTGDTDRGQFFPPGTSLPTACSGNNTNGSVVVGVVTAPNALPPATAPGTPSNSYGFIRFRVKVL